jgi:hypothetical protein
VEGFFENFEKSLLMIHATNCIIKNNLSLRLSLFKSSMTDVNIETLFYGIGLEPLTSLTERDDLRYVFQIKKSYDYKEIQFILCTVPCNFTFDTDVKFAQKLDTNAKHRRLCIVTAINYKMTHTDYINCKIIVTKMYSILDGHVKMSSSCKIISNYTEFPMYSFKSGNVSILPLYKYLKPNTLLWIIEGFVNNPIILAKKYKCSYIVEIVRPLFTQAATCEMQHLYINYHTLNDYIEVGRIIDDDTETSNQHHNRTLVAFRTKNGFIVSQKNAMTIQEDAVSLLYIPINLFHCDKNLLSIDIVKTYPLHSCAIDVIVSSLPNMCVTLLFEKAVLIYHNNEKCEPVNKSLLDEENCLQCPAGKQDDFDICTFDNMSILETAILPLNGRLVIDHTYKLTTNSDLAVVKLLLNSQLPVYVLVGNEWSKTCAIEVSLILELPSFIRDVVQRWQLIPYLTNCLL